ncbi:MAG: SdrD B-like domain-containing protein [Candidatus Eisenbacteria bacterium]
MRRAVAGLVCFVVVLGLVAVTQAITIKPVNPPLPEASVDAVLTYLGGDPGNQIYRYDFTVRNISVLPAVQTVLIFFDSNPYSGEFTGDKADFVDLTAPINWEGTAFVDPDPSPWYVEFATYSGPSRIFPAQSKDGFSVTMIWKDPYTVPGQRFFEAMNGAVYEGQVVIGIQIDVSGSICGNVIDECTSASHPPVTVDLFDSNDVLVATTSTDNTGHYCFNELLIGNYTVSVVVPLGFTIDQDAKSGTVFVGETTQIDFHLDCMNIVPDARTIGYWKHQVNALMMDKGKSQEGMAAMLTYLNNIRIHFNENVYNPVLVYQVGSLPGNATPADSLNALGALLTVNKGQNMLERAKQQIVALLLNVASMKLSQAQIISADGANVSQAITYANDIITNQVPGVSYEVAKDIADTINNGGIVRAGVIPLDTRLIWYKVPGVKLVGLDPNPFSAAVGIRYSVPAAGLAGDLAIDVYDIAGRQVFSFDNLDLSAGEHQVVWRGTDHSGRDLASGIYFVNLRTRTATSCEKVTLIRSR